MVGLLLYGYLNFLHLLGGRGACHDHPLLGPLPSTAEQLNINRTVILSDHVFVPKAQTVKSTLTNVRPDRVLMAPPA